MLTSALRALVNNSFKKSFDTTFMGNEKKKTVKILIVSFHFPKKISLNELLTNALRAFVSISLYIYIYIYKETF